MVGAGFTGCEAAGEIAAAYPDKQITLVGRIIRDAPEDTQQRVRNSLTKLGVTLIEDVTQTAGTCPTEAESDEPPLSPKTPKVRRHMEGAITTF